MTEPAAKEWLQTIPEELRNDPSLQSFENVESLAKSFIETKAKVGKKGVLLPPEGAKDDSPEVASFYEALGRPKDFKEYKIPEGLKLPNGMTLAEEEINEFKQVAHAVGMTPKQFQKTFGYRIDKLVKEANAQQVAAGEARKKSETALRQAFGAKYDERVQGVQKLMDSYGGDNANAIVQKFGSDPDMIQLLGRILDDMSEASLEKLGHARSGNLSPEDAKARIAEIRADAKHPFNNEKAGQAHIDAKKQMDDLYQQAYHGKRKI